MKISFSTLALLLSSISLIGQSLLVNGTFEKRDKDFAEGWVALSGTPDYIHLDDQL